MNKSEMTCPNCGVVEPEDFGMIPENILDPHKDDPGSLKSWVRARACPHCEDIEMVKITDEQIKRAQDKILEFYDKNSQ